MHKKLLHAAHQAGMGEIASGVLHNIGNILTSAGVSAERIEYVVKNSRIPGVRQAIDMFVRTRETIENFLTSDPKGKLLPDYFSKAGDKLGMEHEILEYEVVLLLEKIAMIKNVVDTQQEYAYSGLYMEQINLISIIEDTLKIQGNSFKKHRIHIRKKYPEEKKTLILAQKTKVVDILVNCFKNAWEAMEDNNGKRELSIEVGQQENDSICVRISDNGKGITAENLKKIFSFGFSTKDDGYGFGLHSCAIFMSEMGGKISADSNGPGKGTTLTLVFPCATVGENPGKDPGFSTM
jgi:signal transduction histidine kinase